jgi:hypothetical protein
MPVVYLAGAPVLFEIEPEIKAGYSVHAATITIIDPNGDVFVEDEIMNNDGNGVYSYVWQSNKTSPVGIYTARAEISINPGDYTLPDELKIKIV